jgi:TfoX/Sxy family transcriptional regulator of competence genes
MFFLKHNSVTNNLVETRVYLKSDRQTADELKKSSSMETKTSGKKVF